MVQKEAGISTPSLEIGAKPRSFPLGQPLRGHFLQLRERPRSSRPSICGVARLLVVEGRARIAAGLLGLAVLAPHASAQSIEEKAQICSACHGENGVPQMTTTPVIWGQHAGYLYIELRDYKRGNRKNDSMSPIAESLEREDLLALAEYFSKKPWPNLTQPRASAEDTLHAEQVASSAQCPQCHLGGFLGDSSNPRLAGQNHDYLLKTMREFRSGERANNDWMTALLQKYTDEDLVALAKYLAGL